MYIIFLENQKISNFFTKFPTYPHKLYTVEKVFKSTIKSPLIIAPKRTFLLRACKKSLFAPQSAVWQKCLNFFVTAAIWLIFCIVIQHTYAQKLLVIFIGNVNIPRVIIKFPPKSHFYKENFART